VPKMRRYVFRYRRSKSASEPGLYVSSAFASSLDCKRMFV
jgi:hypothetical protein